MKKITLPLSALWVSLAVLLPLDLRALDFIKENNLTALNVDGSYTTAGVPGMGDKIIVNSTYNTSGALSFGGVSVNALDISTTVTLGSVAWSGTLNLGSGGLTMANTALFRLGGTVVPTANQIWNINGSEVRWTGGVTTNSNTITIQGSGTLNLQGSNITLGSNVIIDKTVSIQNNGSYTFGGANTFDGINIGNSGSGGRLRGATLGDFGVASNFGDGGTNSTINFGTATNNAIGILEYTGLTASSNRTFLRLAAGGQTNLLNGVIEVSTAGETLTLTGNLGSTSNATTTGWSLGGAGNLTVTSDILDNANATGVTLMNKFGNGVLTFSGTNSYLGATTVTTGTLLVNGNNSAATGAVTVSVGATLGGSGTVGGATTIQGSHSPGNSPGLQTFVSDLNYDAGSSFTFELAANSVSNRGTDFDGVNVGGNLDFDPTTTMNLVFNLAGSSVDWSNALWSSDQSWLVWDVAGTTSDFSALSLASVNWLDAQGDLFNTVLSGASFSLTQSGQDVYLNYTSAIPEPSTYAMLLGGLGLLALLRRRKQP